MKKIILVDGNNLVFRSYYATAYTGNTMKNSKGFPTNALYGFVNMMNKIINEEKPEYMAVAFDIGKNFRSEKYKEYKAGRIEMPEELALQFPIAKEILNAMGIPYLELEPYEADDIIGTLAKMAEIDPDFTATIVSSDKDLLQLLSNQVEIKLLKQKDHIRYNPKTFKEDWGIEPYEIIDLKALAGDSSDNIPGVKGVGEKTAITLLQKYDGLDGIYNHIEEIKGKLQEKLKNDKDKAYLSRELATIYQEVPLKIKDLEDIKYTPKNRLELNKIYEELEFYSFIKDVIKEKNNNKTEYICIEDLKDLKVLDYCSFYIECDNANYHNGNILGMSLSDEKNNYFIKKDLVVEAFKKIEDKIKYTFDLKKNIILLKKLGLELNKVIYDLNIAASLLEYNLNKDDIAYIMNPKGIEIDFYEALAKTKFADLKHLENILILKSRFIYDTRDEFIKKLKLEDMYDLFTNIEMPLIEVLADMEYTGIKVDKNILNEMKEETKIKIELLSKEIYNQSGCEFNISSPKQLGEVLFDKLGLPGAKKTKTGAYKTDVKVLHKLLGTHSIINNILEFRNLNKLYTTYLEGLIPYIHSDNKIHTIYRQNMTRTGRLSSLEPNMQNIPTKDEEGRKIRKAFLPSNDMFMSADYSQMELRILAHIANDSTMIKTFEENGDIHTKVAADIFGVPELAVTKKMRKTAKAVIFGIVYGISGFGLGENLEISAKEGKEFIDKYYELYPSVKKYMDGIIEEAYNQGYVTTLFNRKRVIDELKNTNYMIRQGGERIALNTPIQGTGADILKKAMVEIQAKFKSEKIKSKIILQVHDELVLDIIKEEKDKVKNIVLDIMENTIKLKVPIKVEAEFGINWYEAK